MQWFKGALINQASHNHNTIVTTKSTPTANKLFPAFPPCGDLPLVASPVDPTTLDVLAV
jgi:hypothetical protein